MKLKLNNDGLHALYIYVKFLMGYLLSKKSTESPIRIAEIYCELVSLNEIERKIMLKKYSPNPKNKARSISFRAHEAFTLAKYQKVYEQNPHCDKFIEYTANANFPVFWKELLR